jgi:hypothetical protein
MSQLHGAQCLRCKNPSLWPSAFCGVHKKCGRIRLTAARVRELFLEGVKEAAISGVIEPTYDRLPEDVKFEFSFKTFERLVEKTHLEAR